MRIAVVTDSGSGMTKAQGEATGIFVLPLQITINKETYLEGETISIREVYEHVAAGDDVKTSLPPLGRIEELFAHLKKEGYDYVFGIPICTGLSSTIPTMVLAAKNIGIGFDYVDCQTTFSNQLYLTQVAKGLFEDNYSIEDVKKILDKCIDDSVTIIAPNDLKHLAKGGRITPAVALLGGLLKIKPVLYLNGETNGRIDNLDKVHTMRKAMLRMVDYFKEHHVDESYLLTVGYIYDEKIGRELYDIFRENFPKCEILFQEIASVVGVHTGVGCVGVQYIKRANIQ